MDEQARSDALYAAKFGSRMYTSEQADFIEGVVSTRRSRLPRPSGGYFSVIAAPPKYMDVLNALRDGPHTAAEIGATLGHDGRPAGRLTQVAHGRLRDLVRVGAVRRIEGRPLRWELTEDGHEATYSGRRDG